MPDGMQLWMTPRRGASTVRFFLVPRGLRLPSGELQVRSMQLGVQEVDPEAIEAFEVSAREAQAHIDASWSSLVSSVRDTYHSVIGRPPEGGAPDLVSWLGVSPGEVVLDPEKRREGGRTLLSRVSQALGRPLDESDLDRVESQIDDVRSTILEQGGKLVETLERAADAAVDAVQGAAGSSRRSPPHEEDEEGS